MGEASPQPVLAASSLHVAICRSILSFSVGFSPLLFWAALMDEFEFPKAILSLAAASAAGAAALVAALLGPGSATQPYSASGPGTWGERLRRFDPVSLGAIAFGIAAGVATLASISPSTSFFGESRSCAGLVAVVAHAATFWAIRRCFRTVRDARLLLSATVPAAAVASLYALAQLSRIDPFPWIRWDPTLRPIGTMGNANLLAGYLAMAAPMLFLFGRDAALRGRRGALGLTIVVGMATFIALLSTRSRAGYLACAAGMLFVFWQTLGTRTGRGFRVGVVGVAAGAFVLFAALALLFPEWNAAWSGILERLTAFADRSSRGEIWRAGLAIFRDAPIFGSGLDTFRLAYPPIQTPAAWSLEWGQQPLRAHNELIHILATQGLVGLVGAAALAFGIAVAARRALKRRDEEARAATVSVLAGMIAFLVHALFCFSATTCTALFVACAAILSRLAESDPHVATPSAPSADRSVAIGIGSAGVAGALMFLRNASALDLPLSPGFVLACLGIAAIFVAAPRILVPPLDQADAKDAPPLPVAEPPAESRPAAGSVAAIAIVWAAAILIVTQALVPAVRASAACRTGSDLASAYPALAVDHLAQAVALNPWNDLYPVHLGMAYLNLSRKSANPDQAVDSLVAARHAFEQAVALEPLRGTHRKWLGGALAELALHRRAEPRDAFAEFDRAIALDPSNASIYVDACNAAFALQDIPRAKRYAERCASLYPEYAPPEAQLGHVALAENRFADAAKRYRNALGLEWRDLAEQRALARVGLLESLTKSDRFEEAAEAGKEAVRESPRMPLVRYHLAVALEKLGRKEEAEEQREAFRRIASAPFPK